MLCPIPIVTRIDLFSYLTCDRTGLVSVHYETPRNGMLGVVLSTYIRPVAISDSREVKQPAVIDTECKRHIHKRLTQGYVWVAPRPFSPFCFLGHLSATLFSNNLSLIPNKCALPPLSADPAHFSEISFHTISAIFFQVLSLLVISTSHLHRCYFKFVAFIRILRGSLFETVLRSEMG